MEFSTKLHAFSVAAAIVAVIGSGGAFYVASHPEPVRQVMSHSGKLLPAAWPEMSQAEVDALTALLVALPKHEVAIFCANRECEDLAFDFDNAFESAHWKSGIERPVVDSNIGINVAPADGSGRMLASAIAAATHGRLSPGVINAQMIGDRVAIVISRKPK